MSDMHAGMTEDELRKRWEDLKNAAAQGANFARSCVGGDGIVFCMPHGHLAEERWRDLVNEFVCAQQNGTGTEQETATAPAGSATDGAGDAAKPLE